MHRSTWLRMKWFVDHYVTESGKKILDIGSYDVNGSYRNLFEKLDIQYVGLDVEAGPNVDIVMKQPYVWSDIEDESFDYIISGQAFEHIEFPWLTIKEIYKKLKVGGIICIIAPNSTPEHKYPLDCYRYFGDGLCALAKWAGFTVLDVSVAGIPQKGVSREWDNIHNDACLIAMKGDEKNLKGKIFRFPYERRFDKAAELVFQNEFLYKWIKTLDKQQILRSLIIKSKARTVYVFGNGCLGQLLYEELCKIEDIKVVILECEKTDIQLTDGSLLLITIFDQSRELKLYLEKKWKNVRQFYIDDVFLLNEVEKYYDMDSPIYLYGAGIIGRRFAQCLSEYGWEIGGFIVSEGKRETLYCEDKKVFEFQEIKTNRDIRLIVAVTQDFKKEIVLYLKNQGFNNYLEP